MWSRRVKSTLRARVGAAVLAPLLLLAVLFITASPMTGASAAPPSLPQFSTTAAIAADLQEYIPAQLDVLGVPGLSIALIRGRQIIWEAGFGVANTCTGESVSKDSVFEVASLSKPVATYAALTLVDSGALELDEPVYLLFEDPWLPRSEWGDQITLRQLLTHTSGLAKRLHPLDKSLSFEPGERYAYSNVGYQYVQAVMEQATGSSLESVVSATVFEPLAMSSSTFAAEPDVVSRLVSGHVDYGTDLAELAVTLTICFAVVSLLGVVIQRLWQKRIVITWRLLASFYAIAAVTSLPVLAWLNGGFNKWWVYFLIVLAVFSVWAVAWIVASRLMLRRYSEEWRSGARLWILRVISFLACLAVFAVVANAISGPVPRKPLETPSAADSLKTTAGDLARFMIELADPHHLDPETAAEMVTPQVELDDLNSRGLGIVIYHGPDNDWLWHAGDNADFHALMVICPATGNGAVVLTNGQNGYLLNGRIALRVLGIRFDWSSE